MIVLNYHHPLTPEQLAALEAACGRRVTQVRELLQVVDPERPFAPQAVELVDAAGLTPAEWQSAPLLINPPALQWMAVTLLAEIHGRCGYFPAMVRLRPVAGVTLLCTGPTVHVAGVAVRPAERGRGLGGAITLAAAEEGRRRGCTSAALRTGPLSHPLYRRLGFVDVCRHRTYAPPA